MTPYPSQELVRRALLNLHPRRPGSHPRWSAAVDTFGIGSTMAIVLCTEHGLDPHELLDTPECERCFDMDGRGFDE